MIHHERGSVKVAQYERDFLLNADPESLRRH
jgi:hypothetical protein